MTKADACDVAEIHCEALANDFLPSLGKSFLTTLYRCIMGTKTGFGIVYEHSSKIIGVTVATENTGLFFKRLFLKRFWALTPKIVWSLLRHPTLIKRTLETLLFNKQEIGEHNPEAELMVIVLRKEYQHQGIGSKILHSLNEEFSSRAVKSYIVRTYADNKTSNRFYAGSGFKKQSSFYMYNRKWYLYRYELNIPYTIY